jgi:hypothetical protein
MATRKKVGKPESRIGLRAGRHEQNGQRGDLSIHEPNSPSHRGEREEPSEQHAVLKSAVRAAECEIQRSQEQQGKGRMVDVAQRPLRGRGMRHDGPTGSESEQSMVIEGLLGDAGVAQGDLVAQVERWRFLGLGPGQGKAQSQGDPGEESASLSLPP